MKDGYYLNRDVKESALDQILSTCTGLPNTGIILSVSLDEYYTWKHHQQYELHITNCIKNGNTATPSHTPFRSTKDSSLIKNICWGLRRADREDCLWLEYFWASSHVGRRYRRERRSLKCLSYVGIMLASRRWISLTHTDRRRKKINFSKTRVTLPVYCLFHITCREVHSPNHCARQDQVFSFLRSWAREAKSMLSSIWSRHAI